MSMDRDLDRGAGQDLGEQANEASRQSGWRIVKTSRRLKGRKDKAMGEGMRRLARGMERAGAATEERARRLDEGGGVKGCAGRVLHGTADRMGEGADYLRTRELGAVAGDLTRRVRKHPFASLCIALGMGFVFGRLTGGLLRLRGRRDRKQEG